MKSPSNREQQILTLINRYITEHSEPPDLQWLAQEFLRLLDPGRDYSSSWYIKELDAAKKNVATILWRLEQKDYIERRNGVIHLKEFAQKYFTDKQIAVSSAKSIGVVPTQVNVLGYVRAGKVNEHDLDVEISDSADELIMIPEVRADRRIYALRVQGQSMEHEGIFEDDYVIVEEYFSYEWPKEGDLIVTKYLELPKYTINDPDLDLEDFELSGHTLKIYSEIQEKTAKYFRLSWKKDNFSNPHLIKAARIQPVGKVIGVYRPVR